MLVTDASKTWIMADSHKELLWLSVTASSHPKTLFTVIKAKAV
jgi:hypothetical protein